MKARLCLIATALASPLAAQLPAYNVPDDPAFTFLGASPKRIANPGTLPALGLALADGIDVDGRVNAGLAVSFLPTSLVRYRLTPEAYRNGRPSFWLYNTQVSVGTVRKSGDAPATDLAFGVRTILLGPEPYSDPAFRNRMAGVLDRCLTEAAGVDTSLMVLEHRTGARPAPVRDSTRPTRILPRNDGTVVGQDTVRMWKAGPNALDRETAIECGTRGKSRAVKAWMNDHWNDATLALSAATGTRFDRSAVSRRASLGSSLWLVGAVPIRSTQSDGDAARRTNLGQIAAQLHYVSIPRRQELVGIRDRVHGSRESLDFGRSWPAVRITARPEQRFRLSQSQVGHCSRSTPGDVTPVPVIQLQADNCTTGCSSLRCS